MSEIDAKEGQNSGLGSGERPTLKTISRMTGLAVATVSRALNDAPDIGQNTKERVRATAKQIGYRPNRAGVRLRTGKTNVISLVLSTENDMMNHTARLISSIAGELQQTPYHMIVTPYFADQDPMLPIRYIVETGSADAVIINQTQPEDPRVKYMTEKGFPFATHGRTNWCKTHPYFDFDNTAFVDVALRELVRRGRKNVLLILPPLTQNYAQDMLRAVGPLIAERQMNIRLLETATSDDSNATIENAVFEALVVDPSIDAVFASATNACMAATVAIERRGSVVGQHVDLIGKEAIPFLKLFRPGILTVQEDVSKAGAFVARAAMQRIANPKAPPMQALDVPSSVS